MARLRRYQLGLPNPGAKRPLQARENAAAAGWSLTSRELRTLSGILRRTKLDTFLGSRLLPAHHNRGNHCDDRDDDDYTTDEQCRVDSPGSPTPTATGPLNDQRSMLRCIAMDAAEVVERPRRRSGECEIRGGGRTRELGGGLIRSVLDLVVVQVDDQHVRGRVVGKVVHGATPSMLDGQGRPRFRDIGRSPSPPGGRGEACI